MWEHGVPNSILTVIKQTEDYISPNGAHLAQWICSCKCGNKNFIATGSDIRRGHCISCGCLKRESAIKRNIDNKKYNVYDLSGEYGIGYTSNTNKLFYFDLEDYNKIKDYCWSERIDDNGYHSLQAWDSKKHRVIKMHHIIFEKNCDHENRNPLDNRKSNLRKASKYENAANHSKRINNKSGIIGVHWDESKNIWIAQLRKEHKSVYYKRFKNKEDAIRGRLSAEAQYYGEFAPQKELFKEYDIELNMRNREEY